MTTQIDFGFAELPAAASIGPEGKRAWFWQDGSWQVGRAYEIRPDGKVSGMCRDYGPWGSTYGGREPMQTHGWWPAHEVRWKKPASQCERPTA